MGWAALSLRKMTLKQRINNLEQRLVNISQELQSMYDSSSYAQQALGVEKRMHFQIYNKFILTTHLQLQALIKAQLIQIH